MTENQIQDSAELHVMMAEKMGVSPADALRVFQYLGGYSLSSMKRHYEEVANRPLSIPMDVARSFLPDEDDPY